MSFAPAFGAFGDFISAPQLLLRVQQALRDAGGSSARYQSLMKDIDAIQALIFQVNSLIFSEIPPAFKNALKLHVSPVEKPTKPFFRE